MTDEHQAHEHEHDDNPLLGYYEWQVTTLMLAYDLAEPLQRDNQAAAEQRREKVRDEVRDMVMNLLPQQYKDDPELDWPPDLMMRITRATLQRAADIAGLRAG